MRSDSRVRSVWRTHGAALAVALCALASCADALPRSEQQTRSRWETFADVKAAYDLVTPAVTVQDELRAIGFDPYVSPNVQVLTYIDIMRYFLTSDAIRMTDLPPSVQACIQSRDACGGYSVVLENIHRERKGSTLGDLLNFDRQTHETGWQFSALFVLHRGVVTYKLWSGMPRIDRYTRQENPLGPVQEPARIIQQRLP